MQRCQTYTAVGPIAVALLVVGCADANSPAQPTAPAVVPAFSLSGRVTDTANRPLGGSRVEVVSGAGAGTIASTDPAGGFAMSGIFTGTITVSASKDGYLSQTRTVPARIPQPSPPDPHANWSVGFQLEPLGPSANIAGEYTLTVTASSTCTNLPAEARTRTYAATIVPGGRSSSFVARLRDTSFFSTVPCPAGRIPESCTYNRLEIGIAGDYASIYVGIIEQLGDMAYLVFGAGAEGVLGPAGIAAPLDGQLLYCPREPYLIDQGTWACWSGVECDSRNHHLTLARR